MIDVLKFTAIGFGVIMLVMWVYYRIKYVSSGYGKFEYYMNEKEEVGAIITTIDFIIKTVAVIALCVFVGFLITKIFNL